MKRRCSVCEEEKPLTDFAKRKDRKDGHSKACKECLKKRRKQLRQKYIRENQKISEKTKKSILKRCNKCEEEKPITEFCKDTYRKSGLSSACRKCMSKAARTRLLKKNPNAKKSYDHSQTPDGFSYCHYCEEIKPVAEFSLDRTRGNRLIRYCCKECAKENWRKYQQKPFLDENLVEGVDFIVCQICGDRIKSKRGLSAHLRNHGMTNQEYYIKVGLIS